MPTSAGSRSVAFARWPRGGSGHHRRVVDGAVTLAALVHAFGWRWDDWDRLALGSLAGHESHAARSARRPVHRLGAGAGLGLTWVSPSSDRRRWPRLRALKPPGTGGLVTPAHGGRAGAVRDRRPARLPVAGRVPRLFAGAAAGGRHTTRARERRRRSDRRRRRERSIATYADGWRLLDADDRRARRVPQGAARGRRRSRALHAALLAERPAALRKTSLELLGAESTYSPHSRAQGTAVWCSRWRRAADKAALEFLRARVCTLRRRWRRASPASPGRPSPSPVVRLFSCLVERSRVCAGLAGRPGRAFRKRCRRPRSATTLCRRITEPAPPHFGRHAARAAAASPTGAKWRQGRQRQRRHHRARDAAWHWLRGVNRRRAVTAYFAHRAHGLAVQRYELPGMRAFNSCAGAGRRRRPSLRYDPRGKPTRPDAARHRASTCPPMCCTALG